MKSARVYAASIVLNDGRIWILGGLGVESVLQTTEILEQNSAGGWKVHKGPDLPKPLFGHCIEHLHNGKILLTGGFDGGDQTTTSYEFEWLDDFSGNWETKVWSSLDMKRYDHSCYAVDGNVHLTGGWHEDFNRKLKDKQYDEALMKWKDSVSEINDAHVLRSAKVGVSEGKLALIGGVICHVHFDLPNGKNCSKPRSVYELEITSDSKHKWKTSKNNIALPRSSHAVVVVPTSIDYSCRVD